MAKGNDTPMVEDITIDEHINTHYRDYSYYVLSSRGIPSKYDGLIPVQRLILLNTPDGLEGTAALIGSVFKTKLYHHGDQSLAGAIARMCRSFDNSMPLLQGDGFFGNGMGNAAAPRYTKVKGSNEIKEMLKKYAPINEYDEEGNCRFVNLDVPIGLCTSVVGIAIAYRSQILPRKYEDMKAYIEGNSNVSLKPHFMEFKGKITRNPDNKSAWIIASSIDYDPTKGVISINDLPPMMRYDTFLEKLTDIIAESACSRARLMNNSKECVDMKIISRNCKQVEMEKMIEKIRKISSISVPEDIVFADEDGVVRYNSIRDYLDDFKIIKNNSVLKKMIWDSEELTYEKVFNLIKMKFIEFMGDKKRNNEQVKMFIEKAVKFYHKNLQERHINKLGDRIRAIPAYKITVEENKLAEDTFMEMGANLERLKVKIRKFEKNNIFNLKAHTKAKSLAILS